VKSSGYIDKHQYLPKETSSVLFMSYYIEDWVFLFILVDLLVHVFDSLESPEKKMEALARKYVQLVSFYYGVW